MLTMMTGVDYRGAEATTEEDPREVPEGGRQRLCWGVKA